MSVPHEDSGDGTMVDNHCTRQGAVAWRLITAAARILAVGALLAYLFLDPASRVAAASPEPSAGPGQLHVESNGDVLPPLVPQDLQQIDPTTDAPEPEASEYLEPTTSELGGDELGTDAVLDLPPEPVPVAPSTAAELPGTTPVAEPDSDTVIDPPSPTAGVAAPPEAAEPTAPGPIAAETPTLLAPLVETVGDVQAAPILDPQPTVAPAVEPATQAPVAPGPESVKGASVVASTSDPGTSTTFDGTVQAGATTLRPHPPANSSTGERAVVLSTQPHDTPAEVERDPIDHAPVVLTPYEVQGVELAPEALLPGAGLVLGAPRVPNTVAVAVEFARAGNGWAGALVFNAWLGRQLRQRRMSQRQLAALSGVNHSTISRILADGRSPSLGTATKLAHALRMRWSDEEVAAYFGLLAERVAGPTERVESALRSDDELTDEDIRALMNAYLMRRTRRRSHVRSVDAKTPEATSPRTSVSIEPRRQARGKTT